MLARHFVIKTA